MPRCWADRAIMFSIIALVVWAIIGLPVYNSFSPANWLTKDAAGFFTFLLVVVGCFQIGLFLWQLRLIRESLDDAKIAADAAKQSADATKILAEATKAGMLPVVSFAGVYLTKKTFDPSVVPSTGHGAAVKITDTIPPESSDAAIGLKNLGQTSAVVTSCCVEFSVSEELPEVPTYTHWVAPNYSIGREQEAFIIVAEAPIRLVPDQRKKLEEEAAKLWVYGIVTYRDVMQDQWEMGFLVCWHMREGEHSGFDWAHDPRYVFFRKKEGPPPR